MCVTIYPHYIGWIKLNPHVPKSLLHPSTRISDYMKAYPFAGRGVLFNPDLPDGEMHMYGDFPLALFEEV